MDDELYTYGPVESEELMFALGLGDAAATLKAPVENPPLKGVNLLDEQRGQVTRISFTDRPMNRAMLAVREHFKGDKFMSIMMRLFALFEISKHKAVQEWVRKNQEGEFRGHNTNFFDPRGGNGNMAIILRRSLS